ncbi:MAG: hypothetical protein MZV70_05125 [Desulfobacterales bacterium]|nr:hypothetical protein [Desulfobacterales bacterium]
MQVGAGNRDHPPRGSHETEQQRVRPHREGGHPAGSRRRSGSTSTTS